MAFYDLPLELSFTFTSLIFHSLLIKTVTILPRFKKWGHKPHFLMGQLSENLWPYFKTAIP